jgi:hypothetical protein
MKLSLPPKYLAYDGMVETNKIMGVPQQILYTNWLHYKGLMLL